MSDIMYLFHYQNVIFVRYIFLILWRGRWSGQNSLWFVAVDALKVLGEFSDGVGVLLAELWGDGLMLDDLVFDLTLEFLTARLRGACWPRSERRWHLPVPQDGHQGPRARESHLRAASRPKGGQNKDKWFATDPHKSKRTENCSSFTGRGYLNCNGYSLLESKQYLVSPLLSNFSYHKAIDLQRLCSQYIIWL